MLNVALIAPVHAGWLSSGETALVDLVVTIGARNEQLVMLLHRMAAASPLRGLAMTYPINAMVHRIGSAHAAAALYALAWLCAACASEAAAGLAPVTWLGVATLTILVLMAVTAAPACRHARHGLFEFTHRFGGWIALALALAHAVGAQIRLDIAATDVSDALRRGAPIAVQVLLVALVALPWLALRRHPDLVAEAFGGVARLTFPGRGGPGTFARISLDGIEWHAFSIAAYDATAYAGAGGISLLIAAAGDWTGRLIERIGDDRPPARIWVRRVKPFGFMYSARAYRRIVAIATGAGIAPVLPYIGEGSVQMLVVWIAPDPDQSFGDVARAVRTHPHLLVHDTARHGRPDPARLALSMVEQFEAEAVFCVSNPAVTRRVVDACVAAGVPAFGATWDS